MNYEQYMTRYRERFANRKRKRLKGGRRKSDYILAEFWAIGWVLEVIVLAVAGFFLIGCVRRFM